MANRAGDREEWLLQVRLCWGERTLQSRLFRGKEPVTVGSARGCGLALPGELVGAPSFVLASPFEGHHLLHTNDRMTLAVVRDGQPIGPGELPRQKGVSTTFPLTHADAGRIGLGQLAFAFGYVPSVPGEPRERHQTADRGRFAFCVAVSLALLVGLWTAILLTPRRELKLVDYLQRPGTLARLVLPPREKKETNSPLAAARKNPVKPKVEDPARWERAPAARQEKVSQPVASELRREIDRRVAISAGILGMLRRRGDDRDSGGGGSLLGGSSLASLEQQFSGIPGVRPGGPSGSLGGVGLAGSGSGAGPGLGLAGMGTAGYGGGGASRALSGESLSQREKHAIKVDKAKTRVEGGLIQEVVGSYITRYWAQLKYCYEKELAKDPNLYGKVTVSFTIGPDGRVAEAEILQSLMNSPGVEACVLKVIRRIQFPQPKGGGQVIVTYPFVFAAAG